MALNGTFTVTRTLKSGHELPTEVRTADGTGKVSDKKLTDLVREHFDLTPKGLIEGLKLRRPIYRKTAAYGHFGRNEFTWEKTDRARLLARSV